MINLLGLFVQIAGVICGIWQVCTISFGRGVTTALVVIVAYTLTAWVSQFFLFEFLLSENEKGRIKILSGFGEAGAKVMEQPKAWTIVSQVFLLLYVAAAVLFIIWQFRR